MNKTKVNKILSLAFKISVLLLSLGYIYYKIFYNQDTDQIGKTISIAIIRDYFPLFLVLVLLLMPVNWGIEIIKWRYLIFKIEKISLYNSFKAVLVGISFSSFTPNRVGDYFGRALMLENSDKKIGVLITIVGSIAQTIVTIVAGTIGFILFNNILFTNVFITGNVYYVLNLTILIIFNVLVLLFYFKISLLNTFILKIKLLKRLKSYFQVLTNYTFDELLKVLLLSLLRYLVFIFQFYLLLLIFNIQIDVLNGIAIISVIYLVTTIIPTIALTELGIKGAAAIYFFELYFKQTSYYSDDIAINVVAATFVLWILNLAIPALIGSFYVFKMKLFKKQINE